MKVTMIRYEKLVNLGNFSNQKLGVEVQLEDGESPHAAIRRAMAFVEKELEPGPDKYNIEQAERIVANPDDYSPKKLREAQNFLSQVGADEIPF